MEKAGVTGDAAKTATLVMAAIVVQGFRTFETGFKYEHPLTGKRMSVKASFKVEADDIEVTGGEYKPEVNHG